MPAGYVHKMIEKKILGYSNEELQKMMDASWRVKGINHREDNHDPMSIFMLSLMAGGDPVLNFAQGMLHITSDNFFSKMKSKLIKSGLSSRDADLIIYYLAKALLDK